jgi:hypothetical protein
MNMDLSMTLCKFKPCIVMMNPKYLLCIVFNEIYNSGLEILLDYDGLVFDCLEILCDIFKRDWRITRNFFCHSIVS